MHREGHKHREHHCRYRGYYVARRVDVAAEHYKVYLRGGYDELRKESAEDKSRRRSDGGKDDILAEDVFIHLDIVEAEDFQRRDLAYATSVTFNKEGLARLE